MGTISVLDVMAYLLGFIIGLGILGLIIGLVTWPIWQAKIYEIAGDKKRRYKWFTTVPENEIYTVTVGDNLAYFLHNIKGKDINEGPDFELEVTDPATGNKTTKIIRTYDIFDLPKGQKPKRKGFRGLRWVGPKFLGKGIQFFKLTWGKKKTKENKETKESEDYVDIRTEDVPSLFFTSVYSEWVRNVVTSNFTTVDIMLLVTTEITNPHTARYGIKDQWLQKTMGEIGGRVRDYGGNNPFNKMITTPHETVTSDFKTSISGIGINAINDELHRLAGVKVTDVVLYLIKPSADMQDAMNRQFNAETAAKETEISSTAQAAATRRLADAKAYDTERNGGAKAKATELMLETFKKSGLERDVLVANALGKSKLTTLVVGGNSNGLGLVINPTESKPPGKIITP